MTMERSIILNFEIDLFTSNKRGRPLSIYPCTMKIIYVTIWKKKKVDFHETKKKYMKVDSV